MSQHITATDGRIGTNVALATVDDVVFHGMPPAEADAYEKAALGGDICWAKYLRLPEQKVFTSMRQKPVLITAGVGWGKTWMAKQFVVNMCDKLLGPGFMTKNNAFRIPLLLSIQKASRETKAKVQKRTIRQTTSPNQQQKPNRRGSYNPMVASALAEELSIDWLVRTKAKDFQMIKRKKFVQVMRRAFATSCRSSSMSR